MQKDDVWSRLSAPVPAGAISWRADGKATARAGKFYARYVAYIEANTVRERLDMVVPGEWDLSLELLPSTVSEDGDGNVCSFKARLQILGVIREDVGVGHDYKQASTDAFKRAAVRFGIGNELYAYEQNWVEVDGDGKYAKPVEDPNVAYQRRHGSGNAKELSGAKSAAVTQTSPAPREGAAGEQTPGQTSAAPETGLGPCPKCGGRVWDNRLTKRNPKAPDGKCQNRSCDGAIWPEKAKDDKRPVAKEAREEDYEDFPGALEEQPDSLPF